MRPLLLALFTLSVPISVAVAQPPSALNLPADSPLKAQLRLKTGRYAEPAVTVGTYIYVIGGAGITGVNGSIERIDTATNTIEQLKGQTLPRRFATAEAVGNSIYIIGGENGADYPTIVEKFDTQTQKIAEVAPLPAAIRAPASVEIGGKIYVVGGNNQGAERLNTLWIYDPQTDTWSAGAPMRVARECDVVAKDGIIYAIGGFDGKNAVTTCEAYDTTPNTWRDLPDLPVKTSAHHLALVGNTIYSFGDYADMGRVMRCDLATGEWQLLSHTGFDGRRHSAVCTLGSNIYVIGGNVSSQGTNFDEVQVFDATKLK